MPQAERLPLAQLLTHTSLLRLDDEMYEDFQTSFPEFAESTDVKSVAKIDEESMKSPAGKEKWRVFIGKYENKGKTRLDNCTNEEHSD